MPIEFNHAGIVVSDIEASRRFYRDLLGFEVVTSYTMPGITHVGFKTDDPDYNRVEIIQRDVDW